MTSRIAFRAMGCGITARLDAEIHERLSVVPRWFAAWERRLSRFRDDSELAHLNRTTELRVRVSATLGAALSAALFAARWTDGLVTPTVLRALENAGYDRSFDELAEDASARATDARADHDAELDHRDVAVDLASLTVSRPAGLRLDLGGTTKGLCADRAALRLGRLAPALVDAGGDVAVSGPRRDGAPWLVSVADPTDAEGELALLALSHGGVATSGRDRRRWKQDGAWRHHVIDPRTGLPAETDVLSATVVADSALTAEVAAKVVLVLGSATGLAWLDAQPGLAGLVVDEAGRATATRSLERYLVP